MALVGYSDSEGSDSETPASPKPASASTDPKTTKPTFQKVVDKSNPRQIRVNLPGSATDTKADAPSDEPPAKRPRIGGGGKFAGFNSFLPAPKNKGPPAGAKKGLGRGVNLKTGATPAFSREAPEEEGTGGPDAASAANESETAAETASTPAGEEKPKEEEVKLVGKPMMFRPLSVAGKKKKKPIAGRIPPPDPAIEDALKKAKTDSASAVAADPPPKPKPKPSLFSFAAAEATASPSTSEYTPLGDEGVAQTSSASADVEPAAASSMPSQTHQPQTLDTIASDLNLSESARRQLFGRKGRADPSFGNVNVATFSTEQEYKTAAELRASGETIQHNPVKAIASGKHNLKQLINNAVSQQEALDEHFAAGKRNRKEAGNRYGW
jgi:hypothetical protein